MNESHPFDEYFKKLHREIASQNRKWLEGIIEEVAAQNQIDVSQLSESALLNAPDIQTIANDIFAQNTATSIIDDAMTNAVAVPALADVMDKSILRTIADTDFVEAFLDNFRKAVAADSVATLCTEKLRALAVQTDVSSFVEERIRMLAEQIDVTEDFGEYVAKLARLNEFDAELDRFLKELIADTKFTSLLGERIGELVKTSEPFESLDQVMNDIAAQTDIRCIDAGVLEELNRSYESAIARLVRDTEIQSYRHLPWDRFIDLTYGSLADDPVVRPETVEPDVTDNS